MPDTWTEQRQRLERMRTHPYPEDLDAALARINRMELALEAAEAAITQWQTGDCQCPWVVGKCTQCVAFEEALAAIREARKT